MVSDLDDQLGYDADHDDPRQYCPHGTWIGSWWGPDYLCHACEMGIPVVAERLYQLKRAVRQAEQHRVLALGLGVDRLREQGAEWNARVAQWIVDHVLDHYDEIAHQLRWLRRCKARVRHHLWVIGPQGRADITTYEEECT